MKAQERRMCTHYRKIARCPAALPNQHQTASEQLGETNLQSHQQALSLHVGKAEVDAARITIDISIPDNMFDLRVDLGDQSLSQL